MSSKSNEFGYSHGSVAASHTNKEIVSADNVIYFRFTTSIRVIYNYCTVPRPVNHARFRQGCKHPRDLFHVSAENEISAVQQSVPYNQPTVHESFRYNSPSEGRQTKRDRCDNNVVSQKKMSLPIPGTNTIVLPSERGPRVAVYSLSSLWSAKVILEGAMQHPVAMEEPTRCFNPLQPRLVDIEVRKLNESILYHLSLTTCINDILPRPPVDMFGFVICLCGDVSDFWRFKIDSHSIWRRKLRQGVDNCNGAPFCDCLYPTLCKKRLVDDKVFFFCSKSDPENQCGFMMKQISNVGNADNDAPYCSCAFKPRLCVAHCSHSELNPGRMYFRCSKPSVEDRCNFFMWHG
jgi:hypothetical protein